MSLGILAEADLQQLLGRVVRQGLDALELARHRPRAHLGGVQRVAGFFELFLGLGQHVAEFAELGLDRAQHLPDLGRALLQRQGPKAHLQAGQCGQQRGRAAQHDLVLALQPLDETRPAQRLRVQALGGHKEDAEVRGVRRPDVFLADGPRLQPQPGLDRLAGGLGGHGVGAFLRLQQALVVLAREFGIDRQPQRLAIVTLAGQPDRELDALRGARQRRDIGCVLLGRKDLVEQARELHLAKHAAGLDVGQHAVQRADVARQVLHLAQALVHLLQPLGHLLETLAQALLQRGMQLFVDRGAHLLQLFLVVLLDGGEALLDGQAQLGQALIVGLGQRLQLLTHRLAQALHRLGLGLGLHLGMAQRGGVLRLAGSEGLLAERLVAALQALCQHVLELRQPLQQLLARATGTAAQLIAQLALQPLVGLQQPGRHALRRPLPSPDQHQQQQHQGQQAHHQHLDQAHAGHCPRCRPRAARRSGSRPTARLKATRGCAAHAAARPRSVPARPAAFARR
mmetsp:Transcript_61147/g.144388  ORF Transcript_61147/g.144388 Transcript_61147/m.144388 type:complete len:512 (+) Transcript_61147:123-1658(+)